MKGKWITNLAIAIVISLVSSCGGTNSQLINSVSSVVDVSDNSPAMSGRYSWD